MRILVWSGRGICYGVLKGGEGSFGAAGVFSKVADFFFRRGRWVRGVFCRGGGVLAGLAGFVVYVA